MRKLMSNRGETIVESLVSMLIITLVFAFLANAAMTTGVAFASRQYVASAAMSEAKVLESTLKSVISNELQMTKTVRTDESGADPTKLVSFFSRNYGEEGGLCSFGTVKIVKPGEQSGGTEGKTGTVALPEGTPGEIALGFDAYSYTTESLETIEVPGRWNKIISSAAYTHGNKATVEVHYHEDLEPPHFSVNLKIFNDDGVEVIDSTFDVIPLNRVDVNTDS